MGDATGNPRADSAGPLFPGAAFGARYRILHQLGAGGMGVVYQAWDDELGMAVALKVIRPEVTADPYVAREVERRFKRELLLARQVTHANVVRIHDLGDVDGIKYITMPYIEGRDLATVLREESALPIARAVHIARQIAAGLDAAHHAGVMHRDLKPENIMLGADDQALIMDFGISRSLAGSGGTMTALGAVVGTLEYMAPEQGRGEHVDHRADIYSFGLILRDMLVGRTRRLAGETPIAEMMRRMTEPPPSMRLQHPAIPEPLDDIVARCVEPEPDKRLATAGDLVAAFDALDAEGRALVPVRPIAGKWRAAVAALVIAAVLFMGLAAGRWWSGGRVAPAPPVARQPVSVLIADFVNTTGDPVFQGSLEQALGIAVEGASFISAYSRPNAQRTLASVAGAGTLDEAGAKIVAARAGVNVILAGSIAPAGPGYTVAVKAIDPRSERTIATKQVKAPSKVAVLEAIGALAKAIRTELGDSGAVATQAADAETFTAASIEAMRAYARAQELNAAGRSREALKAFEEAVKVDPSFGRAYANMASIYTNLKMDEQAKAYYERALKHLDRMTPREKYRTRGVYYLGYGRDYEQAISNFERLVNEYPADNMGYGNLALAYLYVRNVRKAVEFGKRATEVNPKHLIQGTNYATYSMYAGDFDTAVRQARAMLGDNASYEFAHLTLALSTLAKGDMAGARAAYERLAGVSALGRSLAAMGEADLEMYVGRYRRALEILASGAAADEREKSWSNLAVKQVAIAEAHLAMGQERAALPAALRALELSRHESVAYPVARVLIAGGHPDKALRIAASMEQELQAQTRSYGRLVTAAAAMQRKRYAEAVDAIRESLKLHDSWAGHVLLAEVFSAAGQAAQAEEEWGRCLERKGEATDAFFADTATLRYLPPVYYWLARAQEAVGTAAATANYQKFLELRRDAKPPDPLAADARQRLGGR